MPRWLRARDQDFRQHRHRIFWLVKVDRNRSQPDRNTHSAQRFALKGEPVGHGRTSAKSVAKDVPRWPPQFAQVLGAMNDLEQCYGCAAEQ